MVAILMFSVAVVGLIGVQAFAAKAGTDARYRAEANQLTNRLISAMWVTDRTPQTLQNEFSTGGTQYESWSNAVAATLPGVDVRSAGSATAPTVSIDGNGLVTVTLFWKPPNDPESASAHSLTSIAQIR